MNMKIIQKHEREASFFLKSPFYLQVVMSLDVGFPSVCCEYGLSPLVNKDATLACDMAEYSKTGNPSRDRGENKVETGR